MDSIDGQNYNIDDVTEVFNPEYTEAKDAIADFQKNIDKLPSLEEITEEEHGNLIDQMYNYYMNILTDKTRKMMDPNYVTTLKQYVRRIDEIRGDEYRSFNTEKL